MMETKQEKRIEGQEVQESQKAEVRDMKSLGGMDSGDNNKNNNDTDLSKSSFRAESQAAKQEYIESQRQERSKNGS